MKRLLSRVVEIQPGEGAALFAAFAGFFFLLCGYYLLRPLRDAMGLAGGVGQLPWLFSATFIAMLLLVPVYGWLARRHAPARFVPLVFRFFSFNILLFAAWFASGRAPVEAGRVFFVWLSVYNLFVVSMFWSALADRFSSEQGRRLFAFIAAGGTLGALAGPALAAGIALPGGPALMALLAALLLESCVHCYRRLARGAAAGALRPDLDGAPATAGRHGTHGAGLGGTVLAGLGLLLRDRYLGAIALYFLLHTLASTFLYLEQSRLVASSSGDTAARAQLFALIDLAVSGTTLLLQLFVTSRLLRWFGVGVALALLPLVGWAAFALAASFPTLWVMAGAQAMRRACDYAIARPARELLFTVVSREAKYKVKSAIETVVYRGGDAASAWIFNLLAAAGAGFATLAWIMLPISLAWAGLSAWLARQQDSAARTATLASTPQALNG
ncbi:MAG: transporter [Paucimonas sp.]|nr:transporter [Paucimonas sp.]